MNKKLSINQTIKIYQSKPLSPSEIIISLGQEAKIVGFRKINQENSMPLIEFNNKKRMWLFGEEIQEDYNK